MENETDLRHEFETIQRRTIYRYKYTKNIKPNDIQKYAMTKIWIAWYLNIKLFTLNPIF